MGECQAHIAEDHAGWDMLRSSLEDTACHTLYLDGVEELRMHFQSVLTYSQKK